MKCVKAKAYELFDNVTTWADYMVNVGMVLLFAGLKMNPNISPGSLMNLDGALSCFFIVYLIPILMHLQCYHGTVGFVRRASMMASRIGLIQG